VRNDCDRRSRRTKIREKISPKMTRTKYIINQIFLGALLCVYLLITVIEDYIPDWDTYSTAELFLSHWGILFIALIACFVYGLIIINRRLRGIGYDLIVSKVIRILPRIILIVVSFLIAWWADLPFIVFITCFVYEFIITNSRLRDIGYNLIVSWIILIVLCPILMVVSLPIAWLVDFYDSFLVACGILIIVLCALPPKK